MDVLPALLIPVILASAIVSWRAYSHVSAIVSRRAYSQIKLKRLDLSDCCLGFGWVFLVAATVLATLAFSYEDDSILYCVISQPMSVLADAFVKAFIVFTVLKPLGPYGVFRRRFLYFSLAIVSLLSIVTFILNFVQCKPWSALWRNSHADYCWSPSIYGVLSTVRNSLSATLGFSIALISLTVIRDLHQEWDIKVLLWILVFFGVIASICGSIKTSQMNQLSGIDPYFILPQSSAYIPDPYPNFYSVNVWGFWDTSLLIICGCCLKLKPLYDRVPFRSIYNRIVKGRPLVPPDTESQNTGTALTPQGLPSAKPELDTDHQRHEVEAEERRLELQSNDMYELPAVQRATELQAEGGFELPAYKRRLTQ